MAKPKRAAKTATCRQPRDLTPARHTLAKQSAAVLALGLGLAAGVPAEAAIIYTPLPGGKTLEGNESWEFLTYTGTTVQQFQISHSSYVDIYRQVQYGKIGYNYLYGAMAITGSYNNISLLQAADTIGWGLTWKKWGILGEVGQNTSGFYAYGYFLGQKGYVGLQFNPGDGTHFGWAEVSMPDTATSVTIYGYAYETEVNLYINAGDIGAVPLPSSLLLLGSGAAGLLAYRRRKRAA